MKISKFNDIYNLSDLGKMKACTAVLVVRTYELNINFLIALDNSLILTETQSLPICNKTMTFWVGAHAAGHSHAYEPLGIISRYQN